MNTITLIIRETKLIFKEIDYSSHPLLKDGDLLDNSKIQSKYDKNQLRLIGEGGFGKVFLAVDENGQKIALKVIESTSDDEFNDSVNELVKLSLLNGHPNIMTFFKHACFNVTIKDKDKKKVPVHQLLIEMPLATNTLENILKKDINSGLPEESVIDIFSQISSGLIFAHNKNIPHLDLKPPNILTIGQNFLITDWGGSLQVKSGKATTIYNKQIFGCTKIYAAPEIFNIKEGNQINFYLCDIYSLGLLLLRTCGTPEDAIFDIAKNKDHHDNDIERKILSKLKNLYSAKLIDLIKKMAAFEPKERTSLEESRKILLNE